MDNGEDAEVCINCMTTKYDKFNRMLKKQTIGFQDGISVFNSIAADKKNKSKKSEIKSYI